MENLLFCLNATVPIFLTMMLGCLFKKIGWIDELFTKRLNKFVFQVLCRRFCLKIWRQLTLQKSGIWVMLRTVLLQHFSESGSVT